MTRQRFCVGCSAARQSSSALQPPYLCTHSDLQAYSHHPAQRILSKESSSNHRAARWSRCRVATLLVLAVGVSKRFLSIVALLIKISRQRGVVPSFETMLVELCLIQCFVGILKCAEALSQAESTSSSETFQVFSNPVGADTPTSCFRSSGGVGILRCRQGPMHSPLRQSCQATRRRAILPLTKPDERGPSALECAANGNRRSWWKYAVDLYEIVLPAGAHEHAKSGASQSSRWQIESARTRAHSKGMRWPRQTPCPNGSRLG